MYTEELSLIKSLVNMKTTICYVPDTYDEDENICSGTLMSEYVPNGRNYCILHEFQCDWEDNQFHNLVRERKEQRKFIDLKIIK